MSKLRTYRGVVPIPGYALRWTARLDDGQRFAANTLAEIKELIRNYLNK